MQSHGSAPNLADMDTSSLVYAASRAHNMQRFDKHYVMTTSLGTGGYAIVRKCIHKVSRIGCRLGWPARELLGWHHMHVYPHCCARPRGKNMP
jgi:hypothetical protein